jgi:hypothetical protein
LPKNGANITAQYVPQHWRVCAKYRCLSETESFRQDYCPHTQQLCHCSTFFLWGCIKDNASCNNPHNHNELKASISNFIADFSFLKLQTESKDMLRRARLCASRVCAVLELRAARNIVITLLEIGEVAILRIFIKAVVSL